MQESEHVSFLIQRLSGFDTVSKDPRNNCFVLRPRSDELLPKESFGQEPKKIKTSTSNFLLLPPKAGSQLPTLNFKP